MQHYLLVGYVIIYCIVAIFFFIAYARIVPDEQKKTDNPWETPLDLLLIVVGLAGMLFLLSDLKSDTLKFIWRPVSIVLAATQLYLNLSRAAHCANCKDRRSLATHLDMRCDEIAAKQNKHNRTSHENKIRLRPRRSGRSRIRQRVRR